MQGMQMPVLTADKKIARIKVLLFSALRVTLFWRSFLQR